MVTRFSFDRRCRCLTILENLREECVRVSSSSELRAALRLSRAPGRAGCGRKRVDCVELRFAILPESLDSQSFRSRRLWPGPPRDWGRIAGTLVCRTSSGSAFRRVSSSRSRIVIHPRLPREQDGSRLSTDSDELLCAASGQPIRSGTASGPSEPGGPRALGR